MINPVEAGANAWQAIFYALPLPFRALIFAIFGFFIISAAVWLFKQ